MHSKCFLFVLYLQWLNVSPVVSLFSTLHFSTLQHSSTLVDCTLPSFTFVTCLYTHWYADLQLLGVNIQSIAKKHGFCLYFTLPKPASIIFLIENYTYCQQLIFNSYQFVKHHRMNPPKKHLLSLLLLLILWHNIKDQNEIYQTLHKMSLSLILSFNCL